jgi:3-hydroxy-9,10-secoandrosta-1,3,5(10)-triene-9,17-dione monooxygenase reductase component
MSLKVESAAFRHWMGRWATGVSVVTAREGERDFGLTVNAFLSISLDPPTILVSLSEDANTTSVVLRTRRFAVNPLRADQEAVSRRFAQVGATDTKFDAVRLHRGPDGLALLDGTLGAITCVVSREHKAWDHRLVLGEVISLETGADGLPLLFYRGRYGETDGSGGVRLPPPTS